MKNSLASKTVPGFIVWLLFLGVQIQIGVQARNLAPCGRSFYEDSAGRGLEKAYRNTGGTPRHLSQLCYDSGVAEGQALKKKAISNCDSSFNSGFDAGKNGEFEIAGDECTSAGFQSGRAWLRSQARERNRASVGDDCINLYERACEKQVDEAQSTLKQSICYHTGLGDVLYVAECASMKK